jgi:hypothetical protein
MTMDTDKSDVQKLHDSLVKSMFVYPNCTIANCDCNSKDGEWKKGCACLCHFNEMDKMYGRDQWKLSDWSREKESDERD